MIGPGSGAAVGKPAPVRLVAAYFSVALGCWVAAAATLVAAAPNVASSGFAAPDVLLAVHLIALGFLPPAVTGAALHVLPTLLRTSASVARGWAALPLLCAGPALAVGIAYTIDEIVWPAAAAETIGFVIVAWELVALAARAPRGRLLLASRTGVVLSTLHAAAALAFGAALFAREGQAIFGIPHERAIAVHLHLAVLGWLTLLILVVGRTLGPMLALAPAAARRRLPLEETVFTTGLWLLLAGLALGVRALEVTGGLIAFAAVAAFAALMARVARQHRLDGLEAPLVHFAGGLFFLGQAAVLGIGMLLGLEATPARLTAYVMALLVGWAAGVTLGHLGKLLSLSVWTWWPPGPRPKQGALYPRRLWVVEAVVFAVGVEAVIDAALSQSTALARLGGVLLLGAAGAACAGSAVSLRSGAFPTGLWLSASRRRAVS